MNRVIFFVNMFSYKGLMQISGIVFFLLLIAGCDVQKKVSSGKEAYELKQYSTALDMLTKEYAKASNPDSKSYIAYLAGQSSMAMLDTKEAIKWYEKSLKLSDQERSRYALTKAFKQNEEYDKALAMISGLARKSNIPEYTSEYTSLKKIVDTKSYQKDPAYQIENSSANTEYNEYSPFKIDENLLLFASDRPNDDETEPYQWTGNFYSDLYVMNLNDNKIKPYDVVLNTQEHEGSACLNAARNEIFYTRCEELELRDKHCRIYTSKKVRGTWTDPIAISFFEENVNVGHPALMAEDSLMIFSVGPHGNYDSYDLYYSRLLPTGWTKAAYLPGNINTEGDEKFPTSEKDTLYFSSDLNTGLGGLDIYKCYIKDDGNFSRPEPMPAPINSGADDFGLIIMDDTPKKDIVESGFFTSSRGDGANDELIFYNKKQVEKVTEEIIVDEPKERIRIFLAGKVIDTKTKSALPGVTLDIENFNPRKNKTDKDGKFISESEANKIYKITASKEGYFSNVVELRTTVEDVYVGGSETFNFKIDLDPIELNKEIVIENIFYDFDKWDIRQDAKPPLDSLIQILQLNPQISIELASHTDCQGEVGYNQDLSQKRASSAVSYIKSKGIAANRLIAKGYGEASPAIDCICDDCSDEQNQANRRTTFKVKNY